MVNESTGVAFDDERAVANAGVMLPALLAQRLGSRPWSGRCSISGSVPGRRIRAGR